MLGLLFVGFANGKVLFDPATYTPVDSSQSIDTINGVLYLKVRLNAWNTYIHVPQFIIPASATKVSVTYKYDPDTTAWPNSQVVTLIQLFKTDSTDSSPIGLIDGAPCSDTLKTISTKPKADTITEIQLAGMQTLSWQGVVGSILYISKIEVTEPFDLTTFEGDVPAGDTIDTINGTPYLKVRLDGWNTYLNIVPIVVPNIDTVTYTYKYSPDTTSTYTNANTEAFVQFMGITGNNTSVGDYPSSDTFRTITKVLKADTFNQVQLAGFQHVTWNAINGPLMWISKFKFTINPWTTFPIAKHYDVNYQGDYSANVQMKWDNDSLYTIFNVKDDSIITHNNPSSIWLVDNIEIYFDMANSKTATMVTGNDYQLRVVPGLAWATTGASNNALVDSVNFMYNTVTGGYQFNINFPFKSLKAGFVPAVGNEIGFDVDASNNDSIPNYRNQFTFNAIPGSSNYNTPYYWGTLKFVQGGAFQQILDTQKPTNPTNVVATVIDTFKATLTWNASTDNIHVAGYKVYDGSTLVATTPALSYTFTGLSIGSHTLGVAAVDLYGNTSATVTATPFDITAVNELSSITSSISPNPVSNMLKIRSAKTINFVTVTNLMGQVILKTEVNATQLDLNVAGLQSGVYLVSIQSANGIMVSRIVKR